MVVPNRGMGQLYYSLKRSNPLHKPSDRPNDRLSLDRKGRVLRLFSQSCVRVGLDEEAYLSEI